VGKEGAVAVSKVEAPDLDVLVGRPGHQQGGICGGSGKGMRESRGSRKAGTGESVEMEAV
jgi:hypothetical protein